MSFSNTTSIALFTNFLQEIPATLIQFTIVAVFSLLLGLEQHHRHKGEEEQEVFGTDRTFAFIGLLGYVLLMADTGSKVPYLVGFAAVTLLLVVFYYGKIMQEKRYGITTIVLALVTYGFPLLVLTQPIWLVILFFVLVLVLTELKKPLSEFSSKISGYEYITLAKFIVIAGIILPIAPDKPVSAFIPVSPYKVWLAVVVVSTISYVSYLLRKFIFPQAGLLLTGILGGIYSSTATTVILARKSKENDSQPKPFAAAIVIATAMMFLRVVILLFIFNKNVLTIAAPYFLILFVVALSIGLWLYGNTDSSKLQNHVNAAPADDNPLEFNVALLFAALYVLFSVVTQYTIQQFGQGGLNVLSFLVGFTDINPFLLTLFQGHYAVVELAIATATLQAATSNNILNLIYAYVLSGHDTKRWVLKAFAVIIVFDLIAIGLLYIIK